VYGRLVLPSSIAFACHVYVQAKIMHAPIHTSKFLSTDKRRLQ